MRDRMVADYGRAYLDLMLSYPQLGDILAWGMTDRYSAGSTASIRAPTRRRSAARLMIAIPAQAAAPGDCRCLRRASRAMRKACIAGLRLCW